MRILGYSLLAMGAAVALQVMSSEEGEDARKVADNANQPAIDQLVVGTTVPRDHIENWERRNKSNAICDGCKVYEQPYPGDLD